MPIQDSRIVFFHSGGIVSVYALIVGTASVKTIEGEICEVLLTAEKERLHITCGAYAKLIGKRCFYMRPCCALTAI